MKEVYSYSSFYCLNSGIILIWYFRLKIFFVSPTLKLNLPRKTLSLLFLFCRRDLLIDRKVKVNKIRMQWVRRRDESCGEDGVVVAVEVLSAVALRQSPLPG